MIISVLKRCRLLIVLPLFAACLCATNASGAAVSELGISHFSLQPTRTVETTEVFQGKTLKEFRNEPVSTFFQAGSHLDGRNGEPDGLTATIEFSDEEREQHLSGGEMLVYPVRDPKDVVVDLPSGLLGDPMAAPRCPLTVVLGQKQRCSAATQIGVFRLLWLGGHEALGPIVNVVPEAGQSAEFALETGAKINFLETAHLARSENPADGRNEYGFSVVSNDIPQKEVVRVEQTFWGVPANEDHDGERGLVCSSSSRGDAELFDGCAFGKGGETSGVTPVPFVSMPGDCSDGLESATIRADSWEEPGAYISGPESEPRYVTGCRLLQFNAGTGIEVMPDTKVADEPVGLAVKVNVPLHETPESYATPVLRDTTVTLPEGVSVSPGVVDGVQACSQFGREGINITGPESEDIGLNGESQLAAGHCPDASIVGEAEAITPFLPVPLKGHVYLARPSCGNAALGQAPCTESDAVDGNLYKLYLEIGGKGVLANEGIVFKVPFDVQADPATGQLTTNVRELVQAPYSEVIIHLNGGPRAPLDNPSLCGSAVTTADFTPWSGPGATPQGMFVAGTPDVLSSTFYEVTDAAAGGRGCAAPWPLSPGFVAGTVTPNAGKFSSFTLSLSRKDREQYIKGLQVHLPPGLLGVLASVPLCDEAHANAGTCSEASKIGTTRVASGAGSHPFEIEGSVYLTGPHGGAPFGLSIVTDAIAGPFNLGKVVVRARISVDPVSSALTVTSDETGPYALPQLIFGVPLRLQRITVNVQRSGFMVNPTNCKGQQITAQISGSGEAVASVSSPFAVGGCRSLVFKPAFAVETNGHTSRKLGASLDAKLSYPKNAMGSDANIAYVKVSLPKQLPSYLPTLQNACVDTVFDTDPAACPAGSVVGIAKASTPVLPVGLEGPVYFVSHGGARFPSLVVVLQGDGVRVDLTGSTFISGGITSTTFNALPDVPVHTFELYLPQGKNHALAANSNLCRISGVVKSGHATGRHGKGRIVHGHTKGHKRTAAGLFMPTEFVAQNGAVVKRVVRIGVSGCGKIKQRRSRRRRRR